jgi:hypothetical protein
MSVHVAPNDADEAVAAVEETIASIIQLHRPKKAKSNKTRARKAGPARSMRKRRTEKAVVAPTEDAIASEALIPEALIPEEFLPAVADVADPPPPPAPSPALASPPVTSHRQAASRSISFSLILAAFALGGVGIAMNGWYARSLGSTDIAGWLFLAIGIAADLVALVMPSCAARLWQMRQRASSLAGWAVWAMTFVFAVMAGVGFASTNIADTTLARASRPSPAVASAQAALTDAMSARDRECKGGVGKFCREREATVNDRRQALDQATQTVVQTADPQTESAIRIVSWVTHGTLQPTGNDFAMLRLILMALLPQIGGILLMVRRSAA